MKRFLPLILAALLLLAALPAAALDLGQLTLSVQPVDYVSALAGIAKPVSKTYAANERYAVAVTVQVPQYYDVTNLQIIGEPTNCTIETGEIKLETGTYIVTGTVLAPGASIKITFRDNAIYTASTAEQLYQALQNDRTVLAAAALGQTYTQESTEPPYVNGIPQTGDRAGVAGLVLIVAAACVLMLRKRVKA